MLVPFTYNQYNTRNDNYEFDESSKELYELKVKKRRFTDLQFQEYLRVVVTYQLINLVDLDLSYNCLTNIDSLPSLPNLKYLNVANNKLTQFPNQLNTYGNLIRLNLSSNQLEGNFPKLISCNLTELAYLKLDGNRISGIPMDFSNLRSLHTLILGSENGGNLINKIQDNIISNLINLKHLDVSNNLLTSLPNDIGFSSSQLISLEVSNNRLESLPSSLGQLSHLTRLNLSRNRLSYLPIEMVDLECLQSLDLSGNLLCVIPYDMAKFMNRTSLILTDNPMMRQTTRIGDFSNDNMNLNGNPNNNATYDNTTTNSLETQLSNLTLDDDLNYHSDSMMEVEQTESQIQLNLNETQNIQSLPFESHSNSEIVVPTLTELAARVVLSRQVKIKPNEVPATLLTKLERGARPCHYCQLPYVKEYVHELQYNLCQGHPYLPTSVNFCSTKCKLNSKLHRPKHLSQMRSYSWSGIESNHSDKDKLVQSGRSTPRNWKLEVTNSQKPTVPVTSWQMVEQVNDW